MSYFRADTEDFLLSSAIYQSMKWKFYSFLKHFHSSTDKEVLGLPIQGSIGRASLACAHSIDA